MSNTKYIVHIYTDGACKGNPGPGGWGAVLKYANSVKEIKGVNEVDLELVWEPPWDKSMMSEAAKLELNI